MNRHVCLVAVHLHYVLKIFMIDSLDFQTVKLCNLQAYKFARLTANWKSFCTIVNIPVLSTVSNFQGSIFNT